MSLMDRRGDYSWPRTALADVNIILDKGVVSLDEDIGVTVGFRVVGGLRESFTPNVWTMSWEDNDKLVRLMMDTTVSAGKRLATSGKEVRRARFYWSRDPDLPYRIWAAIVHEDGGAPIIPVSVEDAQVEVPRRHQEVRHPRQVPRTGARTGSWRASTSLGGAGPTSRRGRPRASPSLSRSR